MLFSQEKLSFLHLPTPLEYLPNISEELGVSFYMKRDDLTNLGAGGNKLRKLEYLVKDALDKKATMLLTVGGAQTNHGRLTAAVATKYGLKCVICCIDEYPGEVSANLLLDGIMNSEVILKKSDGRPQAKQLADLTAKITEEYEKKGEKVYSIPLGGSNEIGALGYYECAMEITKQAEEQGLHGARVITAVGSSGTYAGLYSGFKNEGSFLSLTGIAILPFDEESEKNLLEYFGRMKEAFSFRADMKKEDVDIRREYTRGAYNNACKEVRDAIYLMARKEAILLDPCYTGKCFAGILDMIKEGKIKKGEKIIMLHTGGMPGLYTRHHRVEFEKELMDKIRILP